MLWKGNIMANKTNKQNKTDAPKNKRDFKQLKGVLMLLVVMSAIYSIATIALGTGTEIVPKALTAPLALWTLCELTKRFAR